MRPLLILLAILAMCCPAVAQPIVLDVDDGVYVLTVDGSSVTVQRARVPGVTPDDPDDPVIPIPSERAAQIRAAAQGAVADPQRATTAANLAAVMEMLEGQINAGTIRDYPAISASVDWLWDQVTKGREGAWRPTKTVIGNHLAAMAQEGASPEEYSGYFADAAEALGSLQEGEQVEPDGAIDIAMLMKLFEFFVKYILPLIL